MCTTRYFSKLYTHPPLKYTILHGKILKPPHTPYLLPDSTWKNTKTTPYPPIYYRIVPGKIPKPPQTPYLLPDSTWKNPETTLYPLYYWIIPGKMQKNLIPPNISRFITSYRQLSTQQTKPNLLCLNRFEFKCSNF